MADRTEIAREADAFKAEWRKASAKLAGNPPTLEDQRAAFDAEHGAIPPAPDCTIEPIAIGHIRGERIVPVGADMSKALLYHHGGGHAFGSSLSHRHLVSAIASAAGVVAFNMDYPLAPEAPFPSGLECARANYQYVLDQGHEPSSIVLGGESAGGNLTAALLLLLKQESLPLPSGAYLLSPWLDLTQSGDAYDARTRFDPMVSREVLNGLAELYCGQNSRADPLISPLNGDLRGLPPIFLQVGGDEVLLGDATRFAHRAALAGGDIQLKCWPGMVHAWPLFKHRMPLSAAAAISEAASWIRGVVV